MMRNTLPPLASNDLLCCVIIGRAVTFRFTRPRLFSGSLEFKNLRNMSPSDGACPFAKKKFLSDKETTYKIVRTQERQVSSHSVPRLNRFLFVGIVLNGIPIMTVVIELRSIAGHDRGVTPTLFGRKKVDLGFNILRVIGLHSICCRSNITFELTRRREFIQPSPDESSCETRSRRSRPTICYAAVDLMGASSFMDVR